jgi:hypothetical protein
MFLLREHISVQAFTLSSIKIYVFASLRHKELLPILSKKRITTYSFNKKKELLPIGRILNFKRTLVND